MNILQVENLSKAYGEKILFNNISFGLDKGQKVALIARNGSGKSSLMNIISGIDTADSGRITFRNDLRVAYLAQDPQFNPKHTILDTIFHTDNQFNRAIHDYEQSIEVVKYDHSEDAQKRLNECISQVEALNAWEYETKAREILGLFSIDNLSQLCGELSGGQKKKIALASSLLGSPELLLMDEPTNHLDFEMIEWLENYLSKESLSLFIVTHDRYFLDNVCDMILEIEDGTLYTYRGNYTYYLEKKAEREYLDELSQEKTQNLYRTELDWIRRMPKARGTKSKARISSFDSLQSKALKRKNENEIKFTMESSRLGGNILEINNISKKFGNQEVINDFSFNFKRGEKAGVVGLNGTGKTTLLNILIGKIKPDKGKIIRGQTVVMGYYTQDGLQLKDDLRVIDVVKNVAEQIKLEKSSISAAQFLYRFNFPYSVQNAYFSSLSGGEKRRLMLLLELIKNPNFLLLDEPTNDLDIQTLQVLEEYLLNFEGCLIVVSHDRFLLDKLCDHVFVFEKNGRIKDFYGNYTAYYHHRMLEQKRLQRENKTNQHEQVPVIKEKKVSGKPTYKLLKEYETLEAEIAVLENEKSEILKKMNSGVQDNANLKSLADQYKGLEDIIEQKTNRWLELSEIIGN